MKSEAEVIKTDGVVVPRDRLYTIVGCAYDKTVLTESFDGLRETLSIGKYVVLAPSGIRGVLGFDIGI